MLMTFIIIVKTRHHIPSLLSWTLARVPLTPVSELRLAVNPMMPCAVRAFDTGWTWTHGLDARLRLDLQGFDSATSMISDSSVHSPRNHDLKFCFSFIARQPAKNMQNNKQMQMQIRLLLLIEDDI